MVKDKERVFCSVIRTILFFFLFSGISGKDLLGQSLGFLHKKFDFGEIPESGTIISHSFRFGYTGKSRLGELKAETSCECVSVDIFGAPFNTGDSGWVKIVIDPFSRPGPFEFNIFVRADNINEKLEITGLIMPKNFTPRELFPFESGNIRFKADHLTFDKMFDTDKDTMITSMYNQGVKVIKMDSRNSVVPRFLKVIPESTIILPGTEVNVTVVYDAALRKSWGFLQDTVILVTNDQHDYKKMLIVSADICQDFKEKSSEGPKPEISISSEQFTAGKIKKNEQKEISIRIKNTGSGNLLLRRIYSQSECVEVNPYPAGIFPGKEVEIKVRFSCKAGYGDMEKSLIIISNDPGKPVFTLKLIANCVE